MKMDRRTAIGAGGMGLIGAAAALWFGGRSTEAQAETFEFRLSDEQWKKRLSPQAYAVLRHASTERAGSSPLDHEKRRGVFACAGCNLPVYSSAAKFDSGTGWPSFFQPLENALGRTEDRAYGMARIEVHCRRCGGHLGHVFDDGPKPTGLRYCIDGFGLVFKPSAASAS